MNPKPGFLKRQRMFETGKRLIAVDGPVADDPDHDSTVLCLREQPRGDLLDRKVISVVIAQIVIGRTRYRHIDHVVRHPA